jgi:hypothetical protein
MNRYTNAMNNGGRLQLLLEWCVGEREIYSDDTHVSIYADLIGFIAREWRRWDAAYKGNPYKKASFTVVKNLRVELANIASRAAANDEASLQHHIGRVLGQMRLMAEASEGCPEPPGNEYAPTHLGNIQRTQLRKRRSITPGVVVTHRTDPQS